MSNSQDFSFQTDAFYIRRSFRINFSKNIFLCIFNNSNFRNILQPDGENHLSKTVPLLSEPPVLSRWSGPPLVGPGCLPSQVSGKFPASCPVS